MLQFALVHIVLVLPHADALRVDLHQFGQRVHQPPPDAHRAAHRHVLVGKLLAGGLRGRVDACPVLAHHVGGDVLDLAQDVGGLTRGCPVAHGYGLHAKPPCCLAEPSQWLARLVAHGKHHRVVEQGALGVEHHHLASRSDSRIDTHHPLLAQGRGQEQLAQVLAKHADGLVVGLLLAEGCKLILHRGADEARVAVGDGLLHQLLAGAAAPHKLPQEPALALLVVGFDAHLEESFSLAAAHGQETVGGTAAQLLAEVEVVGIFLRGLLSGLLLHHTALYHRPAAIESPDLLPGLAVLAHLFGDDVLGSLQRLLDRGHAVAHKPLRGGPRVLLALQHDECGQGLQTFLAGHLGAGPAAGLVGQIEVLQLRGVPTLLYALAQGFGEFSLFADGSQDGFLALLQFAELVVQVADGRNLHFVESARTLLAVAGDEGNGAALGQKVERGLHLSGWQLQHCSDM